MNSAFKYVAKSFVWGTISKIVDAVIKVISVPLLLDYFGKEDFGLISLAVSVNAYLQILDLGVNIGGTKFFSTWIGAKNYRLLNEVASTSITFYGIIGFINALILLVLSFWGIDLFSINPQQQEIMKNLLLILALMSIINWAASVFNQLLTANEKIAYIQKIFIIKSLFNLTLIGMTIYLNWTILTYFIWFTVINSLQIIPFFYRARRDGLIVNLMPGTNWEQFRPILKYSLAIIAIGIFSMTATKMRPIVLSAFSTEGIGIVTEYRVMETITLFVVSIGSMFISIFLPKTSKLVQKGNQVQIEDFAIKGTLFTSIVICFLCFPIITNSQEILTIYVGSEYENLGMWLNIWLFTILAYLHNSPVASILLATGKTKMLVLSTALSCFVSLFINAWLCTRFGVGSAVIGYAVYILLQMSFYYLYFNKRILDINSWKVFKSFIIPISLAGTLYLLIEIGQFKFENDLVAIVVKSVSWMIAFIAGLIVFRIINIKNILRGEVV